MTVEQVGDGDWVFVCSKKLREGSDVNCLFRSAVFPTRKEAQDRQHEHYEEHKRARPRQAVRSDI